MNKKKKPIETIQTPGFGALGIIFKAIQKQLRTVDQYRINPENGCLEKYTIEIEDGEQPDVGNS